MKGLPWALALIVPLLGCSRATNFYYEDTFDSQGNTIKSLESRSENTAYLWSKAIAKAQTDVIKNASGVSEIHTKQDAEVSADAQLAPMISLITKLIEAQIGTPPAP